MGMGVGVDENGCGAVGASVCVVEVGANECWGSLRMGMVWSGCSSGRS
jgi:hypothetical protein